MDRALTMLLMALLAVLPLVETISLPGNQGHNAGVEDNGYAGLPVQDPFSPFPLEQSHRKGAETGGTQGPPKSILWAGSEEGYTGDSDTAGVMVTLSEGGITYVKDVLVQQILQEITPLSLPSIADQVEIPVGYVHFELDNIVLSSANVTYSDIDLMGDEGITIFAEGLKANLALHWSYTYTAAYIPWPISDSGTADIYVSGMQAAATCALQEQNGTLRLNIVQCGTYIENLEINLHGGASWLYQWFVYLFDYQIRSAIETTLTEQIILAGDELDNLLLNLPRIAPIDDDFGIDLTIVQDPLVDPSFLSVGARGEFVNLKEKQERVPNLVATRLPSGVFCSNEKVKMISIALSDKELNSASKVFYEAGILHWVVDDVAGQSILNTASWKLIAPQLYKKYPNQDMALDFLVSSPPRIGLTLSGVSVDAATDMTIAVKGSELIPVACISMDISMDAVVSIVDNNVTAQAALVDFTMAIAWSDVGTFPVKLVEVAVQTVLKQVILPLVNIALKKGFPLPVVPAIEIKNADLQYENGYILVCADVEYQAGFLS